MQVWVDGVNPKREYHEMRRRLHTIPAVVVGGAVALIGCSKASSTPESSPTVPSLVAPSSLRLSHPVSANPQSAAGNAHITIASRGIPERFSFSATKFPDGAVRGQWQVFRDDGALIVHGVTTCLGIVGNLALIGGEITQTNNPTTDPVGTPIIWTVLDNGEGNGLPDEVSELIIVNSDQRAFHCTSGLVLDLFPEEQGNVQVRP
jgi:hypothetical protein